MLKVQGPACEDNSPGEKHTEETVAGADSQARCREDGDRKARDPALGFPQEGGSQQQRPCGRRLRTAS